MHLLVTGGLGYIGSHTVVELLGRGHRVSIIDDCSNSSPAVLDRIEKISGARPRMLAGDVQDSTLLDTAFSSDPVDAVIHFAGLKAVGESVAEPLRYYAVNLGSTLALLSAMTRHSVHRLVFSSSATVYGDAQQPPYVEDGGPLGSKNPYGQTKVMLERILEDLAASDPRWKIGILRYFNPIGAHESGLIGEDPQGIPNNLAPYVAQVAAGRRPHVEVFGDDYPTEDGTGERDYVHVMDLAAGHVAAIEQLDRIEGARQWNLGTGQATSVYELIGSFRQTTGQEIPIVVAPRRSGDVAQAWAGIERARVELGWVAKRGLSDMVRDAWRWQTKNPQGFNS